MNAFGLRAPSFLLAYATVDFPLPKLLEDLRRTFPITPIFGCTSYEGVFSREGFFRGAALLAGEQGDGLHVSALARRATAYDNEWTGGIIADELTNGGVVLLKTNLQPVGRVVDESTGVPMRGKRKANRHGNLMCSVVLFD